MSDSVIGIAVLDRIKYAPHMDENERLHILCNSLSPHPDMGNPFHDSIPVRPKGTPEIGTSWQYEIKGDIIHVTPSVRISTTRPSKANPAVSETVELFHNEGSWSIPFKEFLPGDYIQAYDLFRAVNGLEKRV